MSNVTTEQPLPPRSSGEESPVWSLALLGALALLIIVGFVMNAGTRTFDPASARYMQWQTLLGFIVTLGIFSILYRENPIFRFLEHVFIGLATGFSLVYIWIIFVEPRWLAPMQPAAMHPQGEGRWWLWFAFLLGLMFFTVYVPRLAWMNRYLIGVVLGYAAGAALQMFIGLIGPQIASSFKPPLTAYDTQAPPPAGVPFNANNIPIGGDWYFHPFALVFIVVLVCTLAYFFFSVEHRNGWIRKPANAGRYFIMIMLGAIFGTTVMGRFSLLIARMEFLIAAVQSWWHGIIP